jgi:hypothetical protein
MKKTFGFDSYCTPLESINVHNIENPHFLYTHKFYYSNQIFSKLDGIEILGHELFLY